jgi:glycosyltransferase involved in cell wall biosynthesis
MSHSSHTTGPTGLAEFRVTHLVKGLGPGGAERLILNQLETTDSSIEYSVLRLIAGKDHLVDDVERTGATSLLIGGGIFWPFALRKKLISIDPQVIHAHSPVLAIAARVFRATRRRSPMLITTEHNRWPRHHWLTRLMNRVTARFDDCRIAVSGDVRSSMSRAIRSSTEVLDHGVPIAPLEALRAKRPEMRARLFGDEADLLTVIGIVANFRPEKAYDVFLASVEKAVVDRPNLRFIVVGQGPGEAEFRVDVRSANLSDQVEVLGYRDDATLVMSAFDIFTLTSRHEGKPVALMEAFALGIPVVATRAGGIPEAVQHNVNGLLADIGDTDGIAFAWTTLVDDPAMRLRLGQAAGESASRFDASVATRSIEALYRSLLANGDASPRFSNNDR